MDLLRAACGAGRGGAADPVSLVFESFQPSASCRVLRHPGVVFVGAGTVRNGSCGLDRHSGASSALPSFWFLGMFEQWNGSRPRFFQPLAARAVASMAVVFAGAAATYALSYYRNIRRIVEEPDLAPAPRRGRVAGWMCSIAAHCFRHPLDRAVLLFVARTMARSRQHRNLLAVSAGWRWPSRSLSPRDYSTATPRCTRWRGATASARRAGMSRTLL